MAITSSTIRIYSDEELETLVKTVTTQSSSAEINVTQLTEGTEYFATVQVVDDGQTSAESGPYKFHTLPDCYFVQLPNAIGTSIYFETDVTTDTVRVQKSGVLCYDANGQSRGIYVWSDQTPFQSSVDNLAENTNYIIKPCVTDEFGRVWVNDDDGQIIRTTSAPPTVLLSNINATGTSVNGNVTVNSSVPITSLEVKLRPKAGGQYITATGYTAQSGTQQFSASGLTPDTVYTVLASARNMGGNGDAQLDFTTLSATATITLDDASLEPQHNTDSVYVEASGSVGSSAEIDTVGVRIFAQNSTSSTILGDVYGQQGESSIATTVHNLPAGTTMYVFAYMDYVVDGQTYTVYSTSEKVVTVPTITFGQQTVTDTSCSGIFTVNGTATSRTVEYKESTSAVWTSATISGNLYTISGLTPNKHYIIRGTVSNESGSYITQTEFDTEDYGYIDITDRSSFSGTTMTFLAEFQMGTYPILPDTLDMVVFDGDGNEIANFQPYIQSGDETRGVLAYDDAIEFPEDTRLISYIIKCENEGGFTNSDEVTIEF